MNQVEVAQALQTIEKAVEDITHICELHHGLLKVTRAERKRSYVTTIQVKLEVPKAIGTYPEGCRPDIESHL